MQSLLSCTGVVGRKKSLNPLSPLYIEKPNALLIETSLVYVLHGNEVLCCGSVESIDTVMLPKHNWTEYQNLLVFIRNDEILVSPKPYGLSDILRTIGFQQDVHIIKVSVSAQKYTSTLELAKVKFCDIHKFQ